MTSNLANIYTTLLRKFGDNLTVTYSTPPSYLLRLLGAAEKQTKIIFLYEEDRSHITKTSNLLSPSKLNIRSTTTQPDELNVTGSPLKDECLVDAIEDISLDQLQLCTQNPWKLDEESHKGINVDKARAIICTEEFQNAGTTLENGSKAPHGSVWILCRGNDDDRTLMLQYEFLTDYFSRGIVSYLGVQPMNALKAQNLLETVRVRPGSNLETFVENTYHIKSHTALRCSWTTTASQPKLNELRANCDVLLTQTFQLNECGPLTQDLMNQLRILMYIRDDILAYRESLASDNGKEPVYRCGRGIDTIDLRENINRVMTDLSGFGQIANNNDLETDIESVLRRSKVKISTDLTYQLWDILKCSSTYKDLKMAFHMVFQCAAHCNIVNTPTSRNRLSEIITEVANRRLAIPCLTGSEPLELLLEIGLEKLHKDYEYIFTESHICSASMLKYQSANGDATEIAAPNLRKSLRNAVRNETNNMSNEATTTTTASSTSRKTFLHNNARAGLGTMNKEQDCLGFKNSNFDVQETANRLARLLQIHCTLEHLLMLHMNLNLSAGNRIEQITYGDVCKQLLQKSPRRVDAIDETLIDEMEITLAAHEVREHLEGKNPHTRRIVMRTKNDLREMICTFYYSIEHILPPALSECFATEDKDATKEHVYYGWLYRKIKTLK